SKRVSERAAVTTLGRADHQIRVDRRPATPSDRDPNERTTMKADPFASYRSGGESFTATTGADGRSLVLRATDVAAFHNTAHAIIATANASISRPPPSFLCRVSMRSHSARSCFVCHFKGLSEAPGVKFLDGSLRGNDRIIV